MAAHHLSPLACTALCFTALSFIAASSHVGFQPHLK